jgi:hypothetical protein
MIPEGSRRQARLVPGIHAEATPFFERLRPAMTDGKSCHTIS